MNLYSWLILAAVGLAMFFAVRSLVKKRKNGGCTSCTDCPGSGACAHCSAKKS